MPDIRRRSRDRVAKHSLIAHKFEYLSPAHAVVHSPMALMSRSHVLVKPGHDSIPGPRVFQSPGLRRIDGVTFSGAETARPITCEPKRSRMASRVGPTSGRRGANSSSCSFCFGKRAL